MTEFEGHVILEKSSKFFEQHGPVSTCLCEKKNFFSKFGKL